MRIKIVRGSLKLMLNYVYPKSLKGNIKNQLMYSPREVRKNIEV